DLGDLDAAKGYPALRTLAAGGIDGLRTIATVVEPVLKNQEKITQWVKKLGAQESANRAVEALVDHGYQALPALMAAAGSESSEVRTRAAELFQKMTVQPAFSVNVPPHGLFGDALRLSRMVRMLEEIGGPEAEVLLARIAALDGRPGDEAK